MTAWEKALKEMNMEAIQQSLGVSKKWLNIHPKLKKFYDNGLSKIQDFNGLYSNLLSHVESRIEEIKNKKFVKGFKVE